MSKPKVVQLQAVYNGKEIILYALRDDGTIWIGTLDVDNERSWYKLTLPR
jgi:hypothetical protein